MAEGKEISFTSFWNNIRNAKDIQEALKNFLRRTMKEMMEAEMNEYLGYEKSECSDTDD